MTQPPGILIVEDDSEIRTLLAEVFKIEGYAVFVAVDGRDALQVFEEHLQEIGLMITDLGLPNLGGIELISMVRQRSPAIRIIGSSGYGRVNIREEVLHAGADEFMPKPYVTLELLQTVRRMLGGGEHAKKGNS